MSRRRCKPATANSHGKQQRRATVTGPMDDEFEHLMAEAAQLGKATRYESIAGEPEIYGSAAFFASATETLVASTKQRRELGGACYFVRKGEAIVLVGIER